MVVVWKQNRHSSRRFPHEFTAHCDVQDLDRDVARIDTIPSQSIETIKDWMSSIELKYYESKVNLNWKNILKSIKEVRATC